MYLGKVSLMNLKGSKRGPQHKSHIYNLSILGSVKTTSMKRLPDCWVTARTTHRLVRFIYLLLLLIHCGMKIIK